MSGTEIGIGIGVVAAIIILGILIYYFCFRKDRKSHKNAEYERIVQRGNIYYGLCCSIFSEYDEHGRQLVAEYSFSTNRKLDNVTRRENQNLRFYKNEIPSKPDGDYIENILNKWKGNFTLLEQNHNYIQWLFPNRKPGVNQHAAILTDNEAQKIQETPELRNRVKRAFEMMLEFYGMNFSDNSFQLSIQYKERLNALNKWGNHNFLRISRILLALKELGYKHLMLPWMTFLADLIYKDQYLPTAKSSFEDHWIETLDAEDKLNLKKHMYDTFGIKLTS